MAIERGTTIKVGDEVYTLDQVRLGNVAQIWDDTQPAGDDLTANTSITPDASDPGAAPLARSGLFLLRHEGQDLYVPFGAVHSLEQNRVVLGVPMRDVDGQGWNERPWRLEG